MTAIDPPRYVTSLALTTAAPTVRSAVLFEPPTIRFPTDVVEPVVGKVTAEPNEDELGSNVRSPAVETLKAEVAV